VIHANCITSHHPLLHNILEGPEKPQSRNYIDYAGPFLGKMFLVAVDATSKWIETHIIDGKSL